MHAPRSLVYVFSFAVVIAGAKSAAAQCPITAPSPAVITSGATGAPDNFQTYATNSGGGVIYDGGTSALKLRLEAGAFGAGANVNTGGFTFRLAAAADVDGDGWVDIVAGRRQPITLQILLNGNQLAPPFPTFNPAGGIFGGLGVNCSNAIVGGDFNSDGRDDVLRIACNAGSAITSVGFFGNTGVAPWLPAAAVSAHGSPGTLGHIERSTTSMVATHWNGDGCLDVLFGNTASTSAGDGQILALINDCGTPTPTFTASVLISSITFDDGPASLGYGDLNGDGFADLVAGSPGHRKLVMWFSDGAGGFQAAQTITTAYGNAQGLWLADFNLDGSADLVWTVDSGPADQGAVYYWQNETDGTPFDSTTPLLLFTHPSLDVDGGAILDFDHDPDNTIDIVIGERQVSPPSGSYVAVSNTTSTSTVDCGTIDSGQIDLAAAGLATTEMAVQSARVTPTESLTGTETIDYYMSNTSPETWVLATDCDGGARGPSFCATFPTPSGRIIKWRAELCRDLGDPTSSPQISSMSFDFTYLPATTQFAAGVVVSNGVAYAAGFQDVGDKGKLFALNGDLSGTQLWEAGARIDAQGARSIYTTEWLTNNRIDFVTPSSAQLDQTLGFPASSDAVINWVRSARFGGALGPSTFGSIVNSTPAVLTPPGFPAHYLFLAQNERAPVDAFLAANTTREVLVFAAGKSGMIHAINSDPVLPAAVTNGTEAWAFVPDRVAANYNADFTSGSSSTRYMDGAPSLADVWNGSQYLTMLIAGGGDGSPVISALDVTDSATTGPSPLWTTVIPNSGDVAAKPAIIRVTDQTAPVDPAGQFMVIAASGLNDSNLTPPYTFGKRVVGMLLDGTILWFFDAACPVTTDITAFETDDGGFALAGSDIDGFVDQVAFADFCGNVYVINVNDGALTNPGTPPALAQSVGTFDTGQVDVNTNPILAFFSTTLAGALGAGNARPIVGGISARADTTTRLVLFFGTGGHEQVASSLVNEFYAVYADDGSIRSKLTGTCGTGCEKFYGNSVITETQVIFTATIDPDPLTPCDLGSTRILFADNAPDTGTAFLNQTEFLISEAVVTPVFAAANAIYIATVSGKVHQLGETTAALPGSNPGQASSGSGTIKGEYIALSGWRQVF